MVVDINNLGRVGLVGRFKPLHLGNLKLLEEVCKKADSVLIGIGSSNDYSYRNPFTVQESEDMIRSSLDFSNYDIIHIPDFYEGKKWGENIRLVFGDLDNFVTGNDYVKEIISQYYNVVDSFEIVGGERKNRISSSQVRYEIARNGDWKKLVPKIVADYIETNGIVNRFRKEFGIQTMEKHLEKSFREETVETERARILEVRV
ncbi:adenylyltransferase/cytidyltransferase family protein [Candidatus Pacearchaeota archaeon]|nr:adenylyltransferase/cytidyltransferase family protein [Candidatus Pacearchaeota archaeon]